MTRKRRSLIRPRRADEALDAPRREARAIPERAPVEARDPMPLTPPTEPSPPDPERPAAEIPESASEVEDEAEPRERAATAEPPELADAEALDDPKVAGAPPEPPAASGEELPAHEAFPVLPASLHAPPPVLDPDPPPTAADEEETHAVLAPSTLPIDIEPAAPPPPMGNEPTPPPTSMERAVHGAHYDASYTVPHVAETLRRFDAVEASDSFAGSVESVHRMPDDSSTRTSSEGGLDMSFDPKTKPPATKAPTGLSRIAVVGLLLVGLGLLAVALTLLGEPPPSPPDDPGLGSLEPAPGEVAPALPPPAPAARPDEPAAPVRPPALAPARADEAPSAEEPLPTPLVVGVLVVRSNKRALVYIDGAPVGFTPMEVEIAPGSHTVRVMQPGQSDTIQTRTTEVAADDRQTLTFSF